ncbi:uncharacterized protein EDB93DRAFT_1100274 [Suillus bovinus]|uniref:uncharacterized protein n=1 Tax=Suillus bovinus TaxID=48563 RepID=UPI001B87DE43|nr:uncharacterized protein EDB93DRAFT_1100274 [Suillus bovinus]KAG2158617.1 hypothetical protein EDB93DRAFT_1100274 [Suillus bovinus]
MPEFELISQFTEDVFAAEDRVCECPVCRARIAKGDPCFYVGTVDPGKPGRYVCAVFTAAGSRPASMSSAAPQISHTFPDPCTIWQTVNTTQRKSTVNPPPVIAFGQGSMTYSAGPDITVPLSWGQLQNVVHAAHPGCSPGYSVNHTQYSTEHEHWAKLSYALPPTETITLDISAVHEVGARKKGHWVAIMNIREGKKDVDACIDAPGLMNIAFDTILPKILTFGAGFPWRIEKFVVQDAVWVNLATHKASVPYFISQCMVPSKKGSKAPTFKTKQFALMLVVPEAQWNEYEEWVEKAEEVATRQVQVQHWVETVENVTTPTRPTRQVQHRAETVENVTTPTRPTHQVQVQNLASHQPVIVPSMDQPSTPESTKRSHRHNLSTTTTSSLPPHKKLAVVPPSEVVFSSPDCTDLKEALRTGGNTTNFDVAQVLGTYTENIQFYAIPTCPLADILKNPGMLGAGGFKTAHPGWLSLTPLVESCFSSVDEIAKLFKEANVLYWSCSLLQLTYAFIDRCIASSDEPPPFNIPRVRFIDASLAFSYSQRDSKPTRAGSKTGSTCAGYLVEELIEGGSDADMHLASTSSGCNQLNLSFKDSKMGVTCDTSAIASNQHHYQLLNPLLDEDDYRYKVASFFAFTQHVQSVGEGMDLFGKGNMECTVSMFEKQHKCNEFCEWRGFGLVPFVMMTEDESTEEAELPESADSETEAGCREDAPIAS